LSNISKLFVISAPSGAGKTSLVRALVQQVNHVQISVSCTTRHARPNEEEGRDYHFISEKEFQQKIEHKDFLEYAEIYGHHYGTSKSWVLNKLQQDVDVVLEIDWQGAQQIQKKFPESILIFILPPSIDALKKRLVDRKQDDMVSIKQRVELAQSEIQHYPEFDYLIINKDFDHALGDLKSIVQAARLKKNGQMKRHQNLLEDLLNKR